MKASRHLWPSYQVRNGLELIFSRWLKPSWNPGSEGKVEKGRGGAASPLISKRDLMLAELGHKG